MPSPQRLPFICLALYGVSHALLSSALLPLWEGYDEPFNYVYVQHLVDKRQWSVTGKSTVSEEIHRAWELAPASVIWVRNIPGLTSYRDYFALPEQERLRRRF